MNTIRVNGSDKSIAAQCRIQAARVLVASTMIKAYAYNERACGNEAIALQLEAELTDELKKRGELVISDDSIIINGESAKIHLFLDVNPCDAVPEYTVPNERCARGLKQQFAIFRAACESYWNELRAKMDLKPLHIVSESIYSWNDLMGVSVNEYFIGKSGRIYTRDA
jgi:hypothetical protein